MTTVEEFEAAAAEAKNFKTSPTQDELLKLYALYKQATVGDNTTAAPGMFDVKGKYKWNAWNELKGTSAESARKQYVDLVKELATKYN
ncbi:hypothetical protein BGX21_008185 [Mortierella sp. AD011]|nr:hypothetical protein BGX20_008033 [Mortierella sp. AD010]KAF9402889.1 hypothetical protein BGX21_008185 [Mortierella sp. AD011]